MQFVNQKINEFLDAVGQIHGEDYRTKMVVAHRGGTSIFVKYPDHNEGSLVDLDNLEMKTKHLKKTSLQTA